jgi:hypothetical protein
MLIFKLTHLPTGRQVFKSSNHSSGSSSFGRAIAFQAIGGQFEPGLPLFFCLRWQIVLKPSYPERSGVNASGVEHPDKIGRVERVRFSQMAQTTSRRSSGVEHFLGREGVVSSILTDGSFKCIKYHQVLIIKVHGLQTLNENRFSKQILKIKQWQKNLSRGINPT